MVNAVNASRSYAVNGYLTPNLNRTNLVILTGQQVTKVLTSSYTSNNVSTLVATGVEFMANATSPVAEVIVNKEVILSAGTVGSPLLLQLSGIGPKATLENLGIQVQQDLPGIYLFLAQIHCKM